MIEIALVLVDAKPEGPVPPVGHEMITVASEGGCKGKGSLSDMKIPDQLGLYRSKTAP